MEIRRMIQTDFDSVMSIYEYAREFMSKHGNPNQWGPTKWPRAERVQQDIEEGTGFVVEHGGRVIAAFAFIWGPDPTYFDIKDGEWLDDSPYAVIHRMAGDGTIKGTGEYILDWAFEKSGGHLRIDTMEDNIVMRNLAEKLGFISCGIIHVAQDNYPRIAFEKSKETWRRAGYVCGIS
ncbi:MAG: GNAT family N-acetyltransferase [Firmicutes bacterium]|nr:GNAT family N-acetyltransferase [Bacillota bacterium]